MNLLSLAVGIIGVALAIYQWTRRRDKRRLIIDQFNRPILDSTNWPEAVDGIKVTYRGHDLNRITRTYILLWNSGNSSIRYSEEINSINIVVPIDCVILHTGVESVDEEGSDVSVECPDDSSGSASVRFNYLRTKEGVIVFVDHSAGGRDIRIEANEKERDVVSIGRIELRMILTTSAFVFLAACITLPLLGAMLYVLSFFFDPALMAVFGEDYHTLFRPPPRPGEVMPDPPSDEALFSMFALLMVSLVIGAAFITSILSRVGRLIDSASEYYVKNTVGRTAYHFLNDIKKASVRLT